MGEPWNGVVGGAIGLLLGVLGRTRGASNGSA